LTKDISKSIRISTKVNNYIELAEGKTFNEKINNIILKAEEGEQELTKRLDAIHRQKAFIEEELNSLYEKTRKQRNILGSLQQIEQYIDKAVSSIPKDNNT